MVLKERGLETRMGYCRKVFTRNKRHYSKVTDEVQVLTPEEFLRRHSVYRNRTTE